MRDIISAQRDQFALPEHWRWASTTPVKNFVDLLPSALLWHESGTAYVLGHGRHFLGMLRPALWVDEVADYIGVSLEQPHEKHRAKGFTVLLSLDQKDGAEKYFWRLQRLTELTTIEGESHDKIG